VDWCSELGQWTGAVNWGSGLVQRTGAVDWCSELGQWTGVVNWGSGLV